MLNKIHLLFLGRNDLKKRFSTINKYSLFGNKESKSGEGSTLEQTQVIRIEIPKLVKDLGIKSFLDAPCGDFHWMKEISPFVDKYFGVDIATEVIKSNNEKYSTDSINFYSMDLTTDDLPSAEMILCRDCLVHLSFKDSFKILRNFQRSNAKYLLTTTFTNRESNKDLNKDFWRPINLEKNPFNFPIPLRIINEECSEANKKFSDKCLGLWELQNLKFD